MVVEQGGGFNYFFLNFLNFLILIVNRRKG